MVAFWEDQYLHFVVTVTSQIEGSYATLKKYLQYSYGDLPGVFMKLKLFWAFKHTSLDSKIAYQQFWPRHRFNTPLFEAILHDIHSMHYSQSSKTRQSSQLLGHLLVHEVFSTTVHGIPLLLWEQLQAG